MEDHCAAAVFKKAVFLGVLLGLTACAGGGAGVPFAGGGGVAGLPAPDPLAPQQPAANFVDGEFNPCFTVGGTTYCDAAKGTIGAEDVYAQGAYGGGVVVAVIDSGIDPTHVDLDANISPDSRDIISPATPLTDELGHGTMVAGVIAAERNGLGTHGVAFDATVLAIRADSRNPDGSSAGLFTVPGITAGVEYAAGRAHVINLSLGIAGTQLGDPFGSAAEEAAFEQALIDAMAADAIVVAATGNEGATEAALPAAYAGDTVVNASGQMLAVGATNNAGDALASFSNQCGSAMNFCLVAPGEAIWTSYPGNNLALVDGTSFAAPQVAGSAALLTQLWPTLTPGEVVDILLTTATDLGAAGVDAVYGHGLLNLNAAIQPVGVLAIPIEGSATGAAVPIDGTVLSLGPAFGDALSGSPLLGQAFALDDYDRDYAAGLQGHVIQAERGFGLGALLVGGGTELIETALPNGATVSMGVLDRSPTGSAVNWTRMVADSQPEQRLQGMSLSVIGGGGTVYKIGYDMTAEQLLSGTDTDTGASLFWMPAGMLGPQHQLIGSGAAFSASRTLVGGTALSAGLVEQSDDPGGVGGDGRISEIAMTHRFAGGTTLTATFSTVDEQRAFLGSDAAGGFAVDGATSLFYMLGGSVPLGAGFEFLGSYTLARSDMAAAGISLLSEWSGARADAFGFGLVKRNVLGTGDRIGFLAGQPLRVTAASATLTLPVDYGPDKTVVQDSERVSLVPSGREIDLQLAYDSSVGARGNVSGWLMMQLEPGHQANADRAYGIGLRFGTSF